MSFCIYMSQRVYFRLGSICLISVWVNRVITCVIVLCVSFVHSGKYRVLIICGGCWYCIVFSFSINNLFLCWAYRELSRSAERLIFGSYLQQKTVKFPAWNKIPNSEFYENMSVKKLPILNKILRILALFGTYFRILDKSLVHM